MKRLSNTWINTIIYSILMASLLMVCFDVYKRLKLESVQQNKEIAISYKQIDEIATHSLQDISTVLATIKQSEAISTVILDERKFKLSLPMAKQHYLLGMKLKTTCELVKTTVV